MEYLVLSIILAFLPIFSYFLQYIIAKKTNRLQAFRNFLPVTYMDWVFIPFNFFWVYSVNLNFLSNFYIYLLTVVVTLFLLIWWAKEDPKKSKWEDYSFRNGRFRAQGWVHGVYALIQGFMVAIFIFSSIKNLFVFLDILLLGTYFIIGVIAIKKLHNRFSAPDLFYIISGLIITIIKFFTLFI